MASEGTSPPGSHVIEVTEQAWGGRKWVVSTRHDGDRGPLGTQFEEFLIDATTGDLLRQTTT
jgi:hypothetical protein